MKTKIKVKLGEGNVIEAHEWNVRGEYEEAEGWRIIDADFGECDVIPYVSRLVDKDGALSIDNTMPMTAKGKAMAAEANEVKARHDLIESYKKELSDTDYAVTKIAEAQALGEDVSPLLDEYSEILKRRKELRNKINNLE